jgi:hypothetical protein
VFEAAGLSATVDAALTAAVARAAELRDAP